MRRERNVRQGGPGGPGSPGASPGGSGPAGGDGQDGDDGGESEDRLELWGRVVARLNPGVTLQMASEEGTALVRGLRQEDVATLGDRGAEVISMQEEVVGSVRRSLLTLMGAVGFVLLIACANVANLGDGAFGGTAQGDRGAVGLGRRQVEAVALPVPSRACCWRSPAGWWVWGWPSAAYGCWPPWAPTSSRGSRG